MIIYFTDRNLNILGQASTTLPGGFRISDDLTTEEIESGVNTFSCRISYNDSSRRELESSIQVGRFILKQSGRAFYAKENSYDSLYQIVETEFDTKAQELYLYAEDAGLDLLGKVCGASTQKDKTLTQMLTAFKPSDWTLKLIGTPTGTKTNTWDGESTCTERLMSVAQLFDCEIYYSFVIERFVVTSKVINVVRKRGNQIAIPQLRLDLDIDRIVTKQSIADLATAYSVTGGTPSGTNTPINLKNYTYSYTDPDTGDVYTVDKTTGQMRNTSAMKRWASALDSDGLILKPFSYDTTNKATLAGQARAALQKASQVAVNYEVDFARLPEDIRIGDRVNIIDEDGELYLEARMLRIESCAAEDTQTATIGEFLLKESGISEQVIEAARAAMIDAMATTPHLRIYADKGEALRNSTTRVILSVSIEYNGLIIEDEADFVEAFGSDASLQWYRDGVATTSGVSNGGFTMTVTSLESIKTTYRCQLELEEG